MSDKTKKPIDIAEVSALSYIVGLTSQASLGRMTRQNAATMLLPLAMKPTTVASEEATDATGIYRLSSATTWKLPDGTSMQYGLVITFNLSDIYKIAFSYLGSAYFIFYNATSKVTSYVQLGSYQDKVTV